MDAMELGKAGVVGGVIAIIVELVVGAAGLRIAYDFSFIAMMLAGFVAGWMIKEKLEDAAAAGVISGLIFIIFGVYLIFPLFGRVYPGSPVGAVVVGIVLGAIGGLVGKYIASMQGSNKPSGKKK